MLCDICYQTLFFPNYALRKITQVIYPIFSFKNKRKYRISDKAGDSFIRHPTSFPTLLLRLPLSWHSCIPSSWFKNFYLHTHVFKCYLVLCFTNLHKWYHIKIFTFLVFFWFDIILRAVYVAIKKDHIYTTNCVNTLIHVTLQYLIESTLWYWVFRLFLLLHRL